MSSFKIRPRFHEHYRSSATEIERLFRDRVEHEDGCPCVATFSGTHIILKVPEVERHYWSPQLNLSMEEEADGTLVRGLYGPAPSVWTLFAFGYFALGVAFVVTGIAAYSYYMLEISSNLAYLLPFYALAALVLYIVAQFGQKLGAEQTYQLHHFYEDTIGKRAHIE